MEARRFPPRRSMATNRESSPRIAKEKKDGARRGRLWTRFGDKWEEELNGPTQMRNRHLRAAGWHVIPVPWLEWKKLRTPQEKEQYMREKVKPIFR